jgi:small ligand-binding sensory domain FIST
VTGSSPFRVGHAQDKDWRAAGAKCLAQLGEARERANFGCIYVTDHFAENFPAILAFFAARLGIENWLGTVGIGICGGDREYFDKPAIAVMIGDLPAGSMRTFASLRQDLPEFVESEDDWLADAGGGLGIVHGDPRDGQSFRKLPWFADATGCFLVGALASSRGDHPQVAGMIVDSGISGMLLKPDVAVTTGLTQGCTPVGASHDITSAEKNIVIQLDGRPAIEVLKEDVGDLLARDLSRISGYIFAARPVRGADWGDYLVRNLTGMDEKDGWLAIGDDLSDGGQLMFCRRDRASAREDLDRMLQGIRKRIGNAKPRGALYHTCLARGPNMFEPPETELKTIQAALGDVPLVGLFGNGEISAGRLYTYTGVLTVFL